MSGTHRRPERYPILEWLKSAGWLAALVLALLLPLTLLGLLGGVIYIAATDSAADPVIFVAVLGICWVGAAVDLITTVRRVRRPALGGGLTG